MAGNDAKPSPIISSEGPKENLSSNNASSIQHNDTKMAQETFASSIASKCSEIPEGQILKNGNMFPRTKNFKAGFKINQLADKLAKRSLKVLEVGESAPIPPSQTLASVLPLRSEDLSLTAATPLPPVTSTGLDEFLNLSFLTKLSDEVSHIPSSTELSQVPNLTPSLHSKLQEGETFERGETEETKSQLEESLIVQTPQNRENTEAMSEEIVHQIDIVDVVPENPNSIAPLVVPENHNECANEAVLEKQVPEIEVFANVVPEENTIPEEDLPPEIDAEVISIVPNSDDVETLVAETSCSVESAIPPDLPTAFNDTENSTKERVTKRSSPRCKKELNSAQTDSVVKRGKTKKQAKRRGKLVETSTQTAEIPFVVKEEQQPILPVLNTPTFVCLFCHLIYRDKTDCLNHEATHSLKRKTKFIKCQFCSKKLPNLEEFKSHSTKYHRQNFHLCNECDLRFLNDESLVLHTQMDHLKVNCNEKTQFSILNKKVRINTSLDIDVSFDSTQKKPSISPRCPQKPSPKDKTEEYEAEMLFYSYLSGNIKENLSNHLDGKIDQFECNGESSELSKNTSLLTVASNSSGSVAVPVPRAPSPYQTRSKTPNPLPTSAKKFKKLPNWQQKFWEKYNFPTSYRFEHRFWDKNYINTEKSALYLKDLSCLDIKTQLTMRENVKKLEDPKVSKDEDEKLKDTFPYMINLMPQRKPVPTETAVTSKDDQLKVPKKKVKENKGSRRLRAAEGSNQVVTRQQKGMVGARQRKGSLDLGQDKKSVLRRQTSMENVGSPVKDKEISSPSQETTENVTTPLETSDMSGEWVRPRSYLCGACCTKFSSLWEVEDHKWIAHPNVYCTHYEFENDKVENLFQVEAESPQVARITLPDLYRRYLQPQGSLQEAPTAAPITFPHACSKCQKSCVNQPDLHKHMLECGGDTTWSLTMTASPANNKRRWKYGSRRRKPISQRAVKRTIPPTPTHRSGLQPKIRTKPGDVESIQKMLANLPEKRTRRAINFDAVSTRSQTTIHSHRYLRKRMTAQFNRGFLRRKVLSNVRSKHLKMANAGTNETEVNLDPASGSQSDLKNSDSAFSRRRYRLKEVTVNVTPITLSAQQILDSSPPPPPVNPVKEEPKKRKPKKKKVVAVSVKEVQELKDVEEPVVELEKKILGKIAKRKGYLVKKIKQKLKKSNQVIADRRRSDRIKEKDETVEEPVGKRRKSKRGGGKPKSKNKVSLIDEIKKDAPVFEEANEIFVDSELKSVSDDVTDEEVPIAKLIVPKKEPKKEEQVVVKSEPINEKVRQKTKIKPLKIQKRRKRMVRKVIPTLTEDPVLPDNPVCTEVKEKQETEELKHIPCAKPVRRNSRKVSDGVEVAEIPVVQTSSPNLTDITELSEVNVNKKSNRKISEGDKLSEAPVIKKNSRKVSDVVELPKITAVKKNRRKVLDGVEMAEIPVVETNNPSVTDTIELPEVTVNKKINRKASGGGKLRKTSVIKKNSRIVSDIIELSDLPVVTNSPKISESEELNAIPVVKKSSRKVSVDESSPAAAKRNIRKISDGIELTEMPVLNKEEPVKKRQLRKSVELPILKPADIVEGPAMERIVAKEPVPEKVVFKVVPKNGATRKSKNKITPLKLVKEQTNTQILTEIHPTESGSDSEPLIVLKQQKVPKKIVGGKKLKRRNVKRKILIEADDKKDCEEVKQTISNDLIAKKVDKNDSKAVHNFLIEKIISDKLNERFSKHKRAIHRRTKMQPSLKQLRMTVTLKEATLKVIDKQAPVSGPNKWTVSTPINNVISFNATPPCISSDVIKPIVSNPKIPDIDIVKEPSVSSIEPIVPVMEDVFVEKTNDFIEDEKILNEVTCEKISDEKTDAKEIVPDHPNSSKEEDITTTSPEVVGATAVTRDVIPILTIEEATSSEDAKPSRSIKTKCDAKIAEADSSAETLKSAEIIKDSLYDFKVEDMVVSSTEPNLKVVKRRKREKAQVVDLESKDEVPSSTLNVPEELNRRTRRRSKEVPRSNEFVIDDPLLLVDELWSDLDSDSDSKQKKKLRKVKKKVVKTKSGPEKSVDLEEILRNFGETKEMNENIKCLPMRRERINLLTSRQRFEQKIVYNENLRKRISLRLFTFRRNTLRFGRDGRRLLKRKKEILPLRELPKSPILSSEITENPEQVIVCRSTRPKKEIKKASEAIEPKPLPQTLKVSLPLELLGDLPILNNNHLEARSPVPENADCCIRSNTPEVIKPPVEPKPKRSEVIDKIFYCEICKTYYYSPSQLRIHKMSNRHKLKCEELGLIPEYQDNSIIPESKDLSSLPDCKDLSLISDGKDLIPEVEVCKDLIPEVEVCKDLIPEVEVCKDLIPEVEECKDFISVEEAEKTIAPQEEEKEDSSEMPVLEGPFIETKVEVKPELPATSTQTSVFGFSQESLKDIQKAIGCTDEEMLILTLLGENTVPEPDILDISNFTSKTDGGKEQPGKVQSKANGKLKIDLKQRMTNALSSLVNRAVNNFLSKSELIPLKVSDKSDAATFLSKISGISNRRPSYTHHDLAFVLESIPQTSDLTEVRYKYQCTMCSNRFEKETTRDYHMIRKHRVGKRTKAASKEMSPPPDDWNDSSWYDEDVNPIESSQFWCSECGINFLSPKDVSEHQKAEHPSELAKPTSSECGEDLKPSVKRVLTLDPDQERLLAKQALQKLIGNRQPKTKLSKKSFGFNPRFTRSESGIDMNFFSTNPTAGSCLSPRLSGFELKDIAKKHFVENAESDCENSAKRVKTSVDIYDFNEFDSDPEPVVLSHVRKSTAPSVEKNDVEKDDDDSDDNLPLSSVIIPKQLTTNDGDDIQIEEKTIAKESLKVSLENKFLMLDEMSLNKSSTSDDDSTMNLISSKNDDSDDQPNENVIYQRNESMSSFASNEDGLNNVLTSDSDTEDTLPRRPKKIVPLLSATLPNRKSESPKLNKEEIVKKIWSRQKPKVRDASPSSDVAKGTIMKKVWKKKKCEADETDSAKHDEPKINQTEISNEVVIKCGPKPKNVNRRRSMNETAKDAIVRRIWSGKCGFQTKAALKTYDSDVFPSPIPVRNDSPVPQNTPAKRRGRPASVSAMKRRKMSNASEDDLESLLEEIEQENVEKAIRSEFLHLRRTEKVDSTKESAGLFAEIQPVENTPEKKKRRIRKNVRIFKSRFDTGDLRNRRHKRHKHHHHKHKHKKSRHHKRVNKSEISCAKSSNDDISSFRVLERLCETGLAHSNNPNEIGKLTEPRISSDLDNLDLKLDEILSPYNNSNKINGEISDDETSFTDANIFKT